ncbi:MAG: GGDEF domain-containing protein [Sulfurimonas sp.]|jgi:diguanylate cyclase (GGDEF)-like protein
MQNTLPKIWLDNLKVLDIAFQPIINIHTGRIYAVEALLRNYKKVGFDSIFALFDQVYKEHLLYSFDIALREKAIQKFTKIDNFRNIKLFYNLDNRLFEMPDFSNGNTNQLLKKYDIKKDNICFEISERHEISSDCNMEQVLMHYKDENFCIAIDDFGVGYSGYKLLYDSTPDVIKIDRFFLTDIEKDAKKKLMVRSITHLAIQLGIKVIAEGVETKEELLVCKDIGCHLVQGYLVQKPTLNTNEIVKKYQNITDLITHDKREENKYKIDTYLDKIKPIFIESKMNEVIDYFKKHPDISTMPVINSNNEPIGIVQENIIKEFLYSHYGKSLLLNDGTKKSKLKNLITPCGIADINSDIATLIELFSNNPESVGIILTNNSKYYGYLSARAIITLMNEENLLFAREQNPLTKLPGNTMIEKYISNIATNQDSYLLCYFDLDNFKAFNDVYGFRNGDRVILLFADILRKHLPQEFFKAHIGGDDFFVAVQNKGEDEYLYIKKILKVITKFTQDAKDFYSQEDKKRGFIVAKDRDENIKEFPMLTVSASIVLILEKTKNRFSKNINEVLSSQKKVAKHEYNHLSISTLL